jgi:hypothetical protein
MPAGSTSLVVATGAATASSTVLITPKNDPGVRLWVSAIAPGSFTISASGPMAGTATIQYLCIN